MKKLLKGTGWSTAGLAILSIATGHPVLAVVLGIASYASFTKSNDALS